jgi:hypothetical protein
MLEMAFSKASYGIWSSALQWDLMGILSSMLFLKWALNWPVACMNFGTGRTAMGLERWKDRELALCLRFLLKHMAFMLIEWAVYKKVFNGFDCDTLAVQANRGIGLADVKEVLM